MLSRRDFLAVTAATATVSGLGSALATTVAAGKLSLDHLLRFEALGQVSLLHLTDLHAQLRPLYFREASLNIGVGEFSGMAPHLTGQAMLEAYGIAPGTLDAYMLGSGDFERLARTYGRVGGVDRIATLVSAIRAERGADRCLLLDGGDALQGSYTSLITAGGDMVRVLESLGVAATTGHWEFTLGAERVMELFGNRHRGRASGLAFLASNIRDTDFEEPVFESSRIYERGGVPVGVIGQAFPHTAIANPRWMVPKWWFGIREAALARLVQQVRRQGARVVVLLSHNGLDVDLKLARRVPGIDVILSGHTHDALPRPVIVGDTLVVASGSHGKFLTRLDLDVGPGGIRGFAHALIPVLADAIPPDLDMSRLVDSIRGPHAAMLRTELARTETTLWRRGNLGGTLDDLICDSLLSVRDAEIALSPGFRWGGSLLPGDPITWEDVYNATAISYPAAYRTTMRGSFLKTLLEDVADNLFNHDPYYQQGGDMVRTGGLSYVIRPDAPIGERISDLKLVRTDAPIEATKSYTVAGWGSVNEGVEGPPVWEVLAQHLRHQRTIKGLARSDVTLKRG